MKALKFDQYRIDPEFASEFGVCKHSVVALRAKFLIKLNKIFFLLYKLVNQENRLNPDSISGRFFEFKKFVMPSLRF